MPHPYILSLTAGGIRSLVAAALASAEAESPRLSLLHVLDGRPNASARRQAIRLQAEWLSVKAVDELNLSHLHPRLEGQPKDQPQRGPLAMPQLLLAGLSHGKLAGAERVIYPGNFGDNPNRCTAVAEQVQLCEHLAESAAQPLPRLECPLLELTDTQVIQLGEQLGVPWHAARSCVFNQPTPCGACAGCHRRREAFEAAGIIDTAQAALAGR